MEKKPEKMEFETVDYADPALLERCPYRRRRTPIMVTLADVNTTPVDIQNMMEAGMNVAKFKMSHSTKGDKIRLIGKIDKAAKACCVKFGVHDWPVATCVELKTCIVRTGILEEELEKIRIETGSDVILTSLISEYDQCNEKKIFVDNPFLTSDVKVGMNLTIAQDEIALVCTDIIDDKSIKCNVISGGEMKNMCHVSIRGAKHTRPYITKKDLQIVRFALEYQVDMIIINYVRHKETPKKIKEYIGKKLKKPLIYSGICTQEGLDNIDEILTESDGIILSREFMAYELDISQQYRMTRIQKWLGAKCHQAGKPFYLSGGVFQDAIANGDFYDNEVADVVNAVLDNVTGFILKDCYDTKKTVDTIMAINELCCSMEPLTNDKTDFWRIIDEVKMPATAARAAVMSCVTIANQTKALVIVVPTITGETVKTLLTMQPACLILTVSKKVRITRLLSTCRCVVPLLYQGPPQKSWQKSLEARVSFAVEYAVKRSWMVYGDIYVTLYRGCEGSPFCDSVAVWTVTISKKALVECEDGTENVEDVIL